MVPDYTLPNTIDFARCHAENNQVELYDQPQLTQLLADHPVRLTEIERFLYTRWE